MNKTLKNLNSLIFKCVASLCHPFPSSHSLSLIVPTPPLIYLPLSTFLSLFRNFVQVVRFVSHSGLKILFLTRPPPDREMAA